ncbi:unnamed protein product, partial [Laminaria digitata]
MASQKRSRTDGHLSKEQYNDGGRSALSTQVRATRNKHGNHSSLTECSAVDLVHTGVCPTRTQQCLGPYYSVRRWYHRCDACLPHDLTRNLRFCHG